MARRGFLTLTLTFLVLLACVDFGLGRVARARFLPETQFQAALQKGDATVATLGDSRMLAGVDSEALEAELATRGVAARHVQLAIGGAGLAAQHLALRRYLESAGMRPRLVLWGVSPDSLLPNESGPENFVGNQAVVLGWSRASDVMLLYPDFPWSGFDKGVRFLAARSTNLSTYASLLWIRVQAAQDRLTALKSPAAAARAEKNQFGAVQEFVALGDDFVNQVTQADFSKRTLHPAVVATADLCQRHGVPLVFVEMPMNARRHELLGDHESTRRLQAALKAVASAHDQSVVNLLAPSWLEAGSFSDGLHLGAEGAKRFSSELAELAAKQDGKKAVPATP